MAMEVCKKCAKIILLALASSFLSRRVCVQLALFPFRQAASLQCPGIDGQKQIFLLHPLLIGT